MVWFLSGTWWHHINVDNWKHKDCLEMVGGWEVTRGTNWEYANIWCWLEPNQIWLVLRVAYIHLHSGWCQCVCADSFGWWFNPSEKYQSSGMVFPDILNIFENRKCSKPPIRFSFVQPCVNAHQFHHFRTSAKLLFICNVSQKCRLMNETILQADPQPRAQQGLLQCPITLFKNIIWQ